MADLIPFQPGFFGASGEGAGKHLNVASDNLDANWANRMELAVTNLYTIFQAEGHYGPFRMETTSGTVTQFFNGDGLTTSFRLHKAIHKHQVNGYDVSLNDPYEVGLEPIGYNGALTDFDDDTKLSNTLVFQTAPPTGTKNINITYDRYIIMPSQLDGGAFLDDWKDE